MKLFFGQVNPDGFDNGGVKGGIIFDRTDGGCCDAFDKRRQKSCGGQQRTGHGRAAHLYYYNDNRHLSDCRAAFLRKADFDLYGSGFDHRGDL